MSDQPPTIYAVTGYIGPNLMRGEWSTRREDCNHPCAEYVLKSATDTRLAAAEAMADALTDSLGALEMAREEIAELRSTLSKSDFDLPWLTDAEDKIRLALKKWGARK